MILTKPTVVCLCGSARFAETFSRVNQRETLAGRIVLSIEIATYDPTTDPQWVDPATKDRLDALHLAKIDLADEILVINEADYIGLSTTQEILYAQAHHKAVRWLECPRPEHWALGLPDAALNRLAQAGVDRATRPGSLAETSGEAVSRFTAYRALAWSALRALGGTCYRDKEGYHITIGGRSVTIVPPTAAGIPPHGSRAITAGIVALTVPAEVVQATWAQREGVWGE